MSAIKEKGMLRYLFRVPVYLYRWRLGCLLGNRLLLLTHTGRGTGLRRQTVLEVVEYREPTIGIKLRYMFEKKQPLEENSGESG